MQIIKSGIIVAFLTFVSRVFGYIRDILIASYLGLNADSFAVAFRLPNTFRSLFAEGAFSSAFVPMFSSKLAVSSKQESLKFASHVFSLLLIIVAVFVSILMIFMPNLVEILAPGFTDNKDKFLLTVSLSYYTVPYLFFIALASLYAGVLNSLNKFAIASSLPIILNVVMILAIYYLTPISKSASHALAYGVFLAGICQLSLIILAAYKADVKIGFVPITINSEIKQMLKNMVPAIVGSGVVQINLAIDTIIASYIDGAPSILYFADRLNQFPLAIIGTALGTVLLPTLSKYVRINQLEYANKTQSKAIEISLFLALPCAIAFILVGDQIIALLFERGHFDNSDTNKVFSALAALSIGLPAFILVKVLTPRYYAHHDTKTPVRISMCCIVTNVIFSLSLIKYFSFVGIALATSLSAWINVFLLYYFQHKNNIFRLKRQFLIYMLKIIFSCGLMSFALILLKMVEFKFNNRLYFFMLEVIIAVFVYFSIAILIGILDKNFIANIRRKNG